MTMDAIDLLIADHVGVAGMFKQYEIDTTNRAVIAEQICKVLTVHALVEAELFYPAARKVLDSSDESLIDEAEEKHAESKQMIAKIKTMVTGSDLDDCVKELKVAIEHHVGEEEDELFPLLQKLGMETINLGAQMVARQQQLMSTVK